MSRATTPHDSPALQTSALHDAVHDPDAITRLFNDHRDELNLDTQTVQHALETFAASTQDETRNGTGRGYRVTIAAAISIACDAAETPRTPDEICGVHDVEARIMLREKRAVASETGERYHGIPASAFLDRFCDELSVSAAVTTATTDALDIIQDERQGSPVAQAGGALWAAVVDVTTTENRDDAGARKVEIMAISDSSGVAIRENAAVALDGAGEIESRE